MSTTNKTEYWCIGYNCLLLSLSYANSDLNCRIKHEMFEQSDGPVDLLKTKRECFPPCHGLGDGQYIGEVRL
jgi:hypothetical protein